jgi:hypothetical protein
VIEDLEVDDVEFEEARRTLRVKLIDARGYLKHFGKRSLGSIASYLEPTFAFSWVPEGERFAPRIKEPHPRYPTVEVPPPHFYDPGVPEAPFDMAPLRRQSWRYTS